MPKAAEHVYVVVEEAGSDPKELEFQFTMDQFASDEEFQVWCDKNKFKRRSSKSSKS